MPFSKSQIDRLGERLKTGMHTNDDLRMLDEYRHSFTEASEFVIQTIRQLGQSPTPRLTKSTASIAEKLRRESIRLSQMQDIAGCRIVLPTVVEQNQYIETLRGYFAKTTTKDLRVRPRFGYRAVHVIVEAFDKLIEVQVRSELQHLWAELSEKSADVLDPAIKYGGGPQEWHEILDVAASEVVSFESRELEFSELLEKAGDVQLSFKQALESTSKDAAVAHSEARRIELDREILELTAAYDNLKHAREESQEQIAHNRSLIISQLRDSISWMDRLKEQAL